MRKLALSIGVASLLAHPAFAEDQGVEGTYTLLGSTRKILETGQVVDAFGKHPSGSIAYGHDGHFVVLIVWNKNDRPAPNEVAHIIRRGWKNERGDAGVEKERVICLSVCNIGDH